MENNDGFKVVKTIPALWLPYGKPGTTYTVVQLPDDRTQGANLCFDRNNVVFFVLFLNFIFKGAWSVGVFKLLRIDVVFFK